MQMRETFGQRALIELWSKSTDIPHGICDKSGLAGCSLKDTKCVLNYFPGCQVCSTITNSGLIQATTFSFKNIFGAFRRSSSQRNFLIIISAFSDVSLWMMGENV